MKTSRILHAELGGMSPRGGGRCWQRAYSMFRNINIYTTMLGNSEKKKVVTNMSQHKVAERTGVSPSVTFRNRYARYAKTRVGST